MKIYFFILSFIVLSECALYEDNIVPVTTTSTTEKYNWPNFNSLATNLLKQTTLQPTTSTPEDTSVATNAEIPEELIARLFRDPDPYPQLTPNHDTSTPWYLSNLPPKTRSTPSPLPVPQTTKPPSSNNNAQLLFPSELAYSQPGTFYHPPSNPQPSTLQQHELPPPFHYIPQEIPVPYDPSSFYNQQDWKSSAIPSENELPYYPPTYMADEIPIHSLHPVLYHSPQIPIVSREQSLSPLPHGYNDPLVRFGQVPFASLNKNTGADSSPFQSLPVINHPPQSYGPPGHIVSYYVRSYIPQNQFHPGMFHVPQSPIVSLQPPGYGALPPPLSQEDIISLIQNTYASSLPGVSSSSLNSPSFPVQRYSNQPMFAPIHTDNRNSALYYSSPIKTSVPSSYYREPRTSVTSAGSNPPVSIFGGSQPPFYINPNNLHFI